MKKAKPNVIVEAFKRTRGAPVPPMRVVPDRRRKILDKLARRERKE